MTDTAAATPPAPGTTPPAPAAPAAPATQASGSDLDAIKTKLEALDKGLGAWLTRLEQKIVAAPAANIQAHPLRDSAICFALGGFLVLAAVLAVALVRHV